MKSAEVTKIAVIGTTRWGTTLAVLLASKGLEVSLWARTEEEARRLSSARQNADFLPGVLFPDGLSVTSSMADALRGATLVILAVPSQRMRANVELLKGHLRESTLILSAAKGLELSTLKRMSCVIADELDPCFHLSICVLSGPNLSKEIVAGQPAASVVASNNLAAAQRAQALLMMPNFRVYTNSDVIGVELGGALKNIVALGAGMGDGLGYGDNAKAAFIIRGLAEITRLGVAAGANPLTFAGLAGAGDLIATCYSPLSRNRFVGEQLAKGRPLREILASMEGVAEGVDTTKAALQMAQELGVEMPITGRTHKVLFEGLDLRQAVAELMGRRAKPEMAGMGEKMS